MQVFRVEAVHQSGGAFVEYSRDDVQAGELAKSLRDFGWEVFVSGVTFCGLPPAGAQRLLGGTWPLLDNATIVALCRHLAAVTIEPAKGEPATVKPAMGDATTIETISVEPAIA